MNDLTRLSAAVLAAVSLALPTSALAQPAAGRALTAAEALALAADHSPSLKAAIVEAERARLSERAEANAWAPVLTATAGYSRDGSALQARDGVLTTGSADEIVLSTGVSKSFATGTQLAAEVGLSRWSQTGLTQGATNTFDLDPGYGLTARLTAVQPLMRGLGTDFGEASLRIARIGRRAAELSRLQSASEAARDVLLAYWELWYAQAAEGIERRALALSEQKVREAELRVAAGSRAPYDLLQLRTEVASLRESLRAAEATTRRAQVELARRVGAPLTERVVADEAEAVAAVVPDAEETLVAAAMAQAFELAQLEARVEQARIEASVAEELARPRLDSRGWVQLRTGEDRGTDSTTFSAFVGLDLELPLDRTEQKADAERARLAVEAAERQLQDARERVGVEAVRGLEALRAAAGRVEFAEETARLAAQSAEGQQARYEAGAATALELLLIQQEQRRAELRVARARADVATASVSLEHLTGRLLGGAGSLEAENE